ncbi:MAG: HAMP domain-containing sensor histidine kinase [Ferruginibacter sp.]
MPIKVRVTLFFTMIVFAILTIVCISIYTIAYTNREKNFKTRLTNRAATTARLLSQTDVFNQALLQKIDSSTSAAMLNKSIQAYNYEGRRVYNYADNAADIILVSDDILEQAKKKNFVYFTVDKKDAVAYHYFDGNARLIIITAAYDPEGQKNLEQLRFILWICFWGGILITIAGGYVFSKSLLRPVKKIADEVNDITAQNLAMRIKSYKQNDEWNYLAETINTLLNRLEESFETQGRFIANASHEISTPLTSIYSQLEVSLQKDRDATAYRLVMQSVLEDVHHLNKLTQTLLQFAKASGTSSGIEISLLRIDEILLRMPGEMFKLNKEYHVKILFNELPAEETRLLVFGNEGLLFSAIKNIVINACKYSADRVALLQLSVLEGEVIVTVTDKGAGISKESLAFIFQPFYRADEIRSEEGFGLGLPLAARIIALHKGKIKVNSTPGQGSRFVIQLPIAGSSKA